MDQLEDLVLLPPENYLPTQQVKAVAGGGGGGGISTSPRLWRVQPSFSLGQIDSFWLDYNLAQGNSDKKEKV